MSSSRTIMESNLVEFVIRFNSYNDYSNLYFKNALLQLFDHYAELSRGNEKMQTLIKIAKKQVVVLYPHKLVNDRREIDHESSKKHLLFVASNLNKENESNYHEILEKVIISVYHIDHNKLKDAEKSLLYDLPLKLFLLEQTSTSSADVKYKKKKRNKKLRKLGDYLEDLENISNILSSETKTSTLRLIENEVKKTLKNHDLKTKSKKILDTINKISSEQNFEKSVTSDGASDQKSNHSGKSHFSDKCSLQLDRCQIKLGSEEHTNKTCSSVCDKDSDFSFDTTVLNVSEITDQNSNDTLSENYAQYNKAKMSFNAVEKCSREDTEANFCNSNTSVHSSLQICDHESITTQTTNPPHSNPDDTTKFEVKEKCFSNQVEEVFTKKENESFDDCSSGKLEEVDLTNVDQKVITPSESDNPSLSASITQVAEVEILELNDHFSENNKAIELPTNGEDLVSIIRSRAQQLQEKVECYEGSDYSVEFYIIRENLVCLLEKLDKVDCKNNKPLFDVVIETIDYIKKLLSTLQSNAINSD